MTDPMSSFPFDGLSVVVTGNVPGLDRNQATAAVAALGGKSMASVSGKTSLVVMGEGAGVSKTAKVRQHNIPVLSAAEFATLVRDPSSWDGAPVGGPLDEIKNAPGAAADDASADSGPFVMPDHMVGLASAPSTDGRMEYRCWCRCGHAWLGATSSDQSRGCPADPTSRAAKAAETAGTPLDVDDALALRAKWNLGQWPDMAARLRDMEAAQVAAREKPQHDLADQTNETLLAF